MCVEVKEISIKDINALVIVHKRAFPDFFLTSLGDRFLSLYYKTVKKNNQGILLGYYRKEKLLGFCAATMVSTSFHSRLIKENLLDYSFIAFRLLFFRPLSIARLYKNLVKKGSSVKDKGNYAELLSIAVDTSCQGEGIGKKLLNELEKIVIERGGDCLSLTTDFEDNAKAQGFYTSIGYKVFYDFVAYPKRKMYRYIKNLNK
ncbi:MAG: GNAT family N-acetyltransferase [Bacteroides sp.]|jgi:hypothetical protein|uniref:GNAT family N-acetyltransferase n=1 Tax=Bacteroides TaxID=816 RepID=UPI0025B844B4|nr:GNAT family N-acetyltransferase [Bacteroides sp.]MBS6237188.1 GNAT family N-acetyltransferase [Bacteroides sp.]